MAVNQTRNEATIIAGTPEWRGPRCEEPLRVPSWPQRYFTADPFWVECPNAREAPPSMAVPAVANLIPFIWVFDCALEVGELDKTFHEDVLSIKRGYTKILPTLFLAGFLSVASVIDNRWSEDIGGPLLPFFERVGAMCTLVGCADEKPYFASKWGPDIRSGNKDEWKIVDDSSRNVAQNLGLRYPNARSNLTEMINGGALDAKPVEKWSSYAWWHDLQHSIRPLSLAALPAHTTGATIVYIASSGAVKDRSVYAYASDSTIDNHFAVGRIRLFTLLTSLGGKTRSRRLPVMRRLTKTISAESLLSHGVRKELLPLREVR